MIKSKYLIIYLIVMFSSCELRNKLTFYPDRRSKISPNDIPGYIVEHNITTKDNERLQTFLFKHEALKDPGLVIYFHGNAGNLYHRFEFANRLFDMGCDVLLVSYRGYSKSTGTPSEKGIYVDGETAIKYAIDSLGYLEEKIILFGRSIGTTVVVHNAQNRKFKGVVLITPLTSGKEMATAMGLSFLKFIAGDSYNTIEKINELKSKLLIIHGTNDNIIPYKMGQELYKTYNGEKYFVTIDGGNHDDLQDVNSGLFWRKIEEFIK